MVVKCIRLGEDKKYFTQQLVREHVEAESHESFRYGWSKIVMIK